MFYGKEPKDDNKYQWTNHAKEKMRYYRISESLVKRIVRFPKRSEEGIAPGTTAVMVPRLIGSRKVETIGKSNSSTSWRSRRSNQEEIWVMYINVGKKPDSIISTQKKRIITAWRYPGVSPSGKQIPIPEDILSELGDF